MKGRSEVLQPFVYVTRARWTECVQSSGGTIRVSKGRPDIESLMRQEAAEKLGCMGVSVCSSGGLADEVRRVSRVMLDKGVNLDFVEERFGW